MFERKLRKREIGLALVAIIIVAIITIIVTIILAVLIIKKYSILNAIIYCPKIFSISSK